MESALAAKAGIVPVHFRCTKPDVFGKFGWARRTGVVDELAEVKAGIRMSERQAEGIQAGPRSSSG